MSLKNFLSGHSVSSICLEPWVRLGGFLSLAMNVESFIIKLFFKGQSLHLTREEFLTIQEISASRCGSSNDKNQPAPIDLTNNPIFAAIPVCLGKWSYKVFLCQTCFHSKQRVDDGEYIILVMHARNTSVEPKVGMT